MQQFYLLEVDKDYQSMQWQTMCIHHSNINFNSNLCTAAFFVLFK